MLLCTQRLQATLPQKSKYYLLLLLLALDERAHSKRIINLRKWYIFRDVETSSKPPQHAEIHNL
jgi:hypothetical protein